MLAFAAILATLDDPFYDPPEHLVKYETPQQRRSYTAWASKLRDDLIGDAEPAMPPTLGGGRRDEHDGPPQLGERVEGRRVRERFDSGVVWWSRATSV